MFVRMRQARVLQDAGHARQLSAGEVYDLPDVVAHSLLDQRIAERPKRGKLRQPTTKRAAPERKPAQPAETKAAS